MDKSVKEQAIFVFDEDKFLEKVLIEDIYYIETIKSTHYCNVYHKKGQGRLRADIIHLQEELGEEFLKVRSSTLVNVKYISKLDRKNRILYFADSRHLCCTYAAQCFTELKRRLNIRSYRK